MEQSECYGRDYALKSMDNAAILQSNLWKAQILNWKQREDKLISMIIMLELVSVQ